MKEFLKKQGIVFYVSAVSAVIALVAMIITLVSSSVVGYEIPGIAWVVVATIAVLLLVATATVLSGKAKNEAVIYACLLVATVLCVICFGIIISARAYLVGTLWITVLDSTNPLAVKAMNTATAAFAMYLVSVIMFIVTGFLKAKKN